LKATALPPRPAQKCEVEELITVYTFDTNRSIQVSKKIPESLDGWTKSLKTEEESDRLMPAAPKQTNGKPQLINRWWNRA
jgi:hypothetical protein